MKLRIAFAFALSVFALAAHAEKIALIGGTVINPADGKITRNATVFVDNGRITNIAANMVMKFGGRTVDCAGKFILPGYIDTHVHFFQSGDLFTRPDGADFNSVRPYKEVRQWRDRREHGCDLVAKIRAHGRETGETNHKIYREVPQLRHQLQSRRRHGAHLHREARRDGRTAGAALARI